MDSATRTLHRRFQRCAIYCLRECWSLCSPWYFATVLQSIISVVCTFRGTTLVRLEMRKQQQNLNSKISSPMSTAPSAKRISLLFSLELPRRLDPSVVRFTELKETKYFFCECTFLQLRTRCVSSSSFALRGRNYQAPGCLGLFLHRPQSFLANCRDLITNGGGGGGKFSPSNNVYNGDF